MTSNDRLILDADLPTDADVTADDLFDALADARRRYVLTSLTDGSGPTRLDTLADELADCDGEGVATVTTGDSRTLHRRLYHVDVPKLSEAGLVEFDPDSQTVALAEAGDELVTEAGLVLVE